MAIVKKIPVAKVGEIGPGQTKHFRLGFREGIAYNDAGTLKAYVNACTHMGGATKFERGVFRCVRHGAEFDPSTGERRSGQAPEGTRLAHVDLEFEGDDVFALLVINDEM